MPLLLLRSIGEKHSYQSDVARLLDIIINNLYSRKEIFLRASAAQRLGGSPGAKMPPSHLSVILLSSRRRAHLERL